MTEWGVGGVDIEKGWKHQSLVSPTLHTSTTKVSYR
jgi:hypothetical protein